MRIPISLYIHMPWCVQKCPYCDFNSHALKGEMPEIRYVDRLIEELRTHLPLIENRSIYSIFIGGGTPSLFSPKAYEKLWAGLNQHLTFTPHMEVTLEANPGTVEQTYFKAYREIGINRLSLGIQSFENEKLKTLGRIHNGTEARRAIEITQQYFNNFNIDLMHGLPNQTSEQALSDLNTAIQFSPTHLSWYQLTLEPNTFFYKHPPTLPQDDTLWEIQKEGQQLLAENHYLHYEVSAYSHQNFTCRHNVNYWEFGDYLGLGAGAHSKITLETGTISRHQNIKNPKNYLNASQNAIEEHKVLTPEALIFEFMLNALRLQKPISLDLFSQRTGLPSSLLEKPLQKANQLGLIESLGTNFTLTPQGHLFLNDLTELFLPADAKD